MIDYEDIVAAYDDITGSEEGAEFEIEDVEMRYEMLGIDFDSFKLFMFARLQALSQIYGFNEEWGRGYVHAAMEFFLYGDLCGKQTALNSEIDGDPT